MSHDTGFGRCAAIVGLAGALILLALPVAAGQNQVRRINQQGNQLYTEEQWAEALAAYTAAGEIDPENAVLHYNLGNALYRLNDLDKAETHYRMAAAAGDSDLARQARFNLGNTEFRRAETLEGAGDWQGRNQALTKAIESWQSVLETEPQNRDAKLNLEIARQKLLEKPPENQQQQQDQQDQEPQQDQEQKQDQDQQQEQDQKEDQEPDQQQQEEQEQPKEQQEEQGEDQQSDQGEEQQDQEDQQAKAQPQDGEDQERAGEEQMEEMRISPEEAERILDALRDEELEEQRRQMAERKGRGGSAERDW